jgi:hypothetical protein
VAVLRYYRDHSRPDRNFHCTRQQMTTDTADVYNEYDKKETKLFDKNHKHHYITHIRGSDSKE